jgi:hypothetical protein
MPKYHETSTHLLLRPRQTILQLSPLFIQDSYFHAQRIITLDQLVHELIGHMILLELECRHVASIQRRLAGRRYHIVEGAAPSDELVGRRRRRRRSCSAIPCACAYVFGA